MAEALALALTAAAEALALALTAAAGALALALAVRRCLASVFLFRSGFGPPLTSETSPLGNVRVCLCVFSYGWVLGVTTGLWQSYPPQEHIWLKGNQPQDALEV